MAEAGVTHKKIVHLAAREGYDRWAKLYDQEDNPLIALEEREVSCHLGDVRGLNVADVGCGTGRHALMLARAGARVAAVDFSDGMLARARCKLNSQAVQLVKHDLQTPLPFKPRFFDRVMCGLVLDHISNPGGLLRELGRICRPDGFILLTVMHPAMGLCGLQARFTDPHTDELIYPGSARNKMSDYVMAATNADLCFEHISEHTVDEDLVAVSPRAEKYLGWPLLLIMKLSHGRK